MDIKPDVRIKLESDDPEKRAYLQELADHLALPKPSPDIGTADFYLLLRNSRLELHRAKTEEEKQSPLCIDFLSGPSYYRFIQNKRIDQPLAKAIGIKRGYRPTILDTTAGFGEDSFVLAALGCSVTMLERSGVIWALLNNAITRSLNNPQTHNIFAEQVKLLHIDSADFLVATAHSFETIYLDPMYPLHRSSALNKQKMRLLRDLVGSDLDSCHLLPLAINKAAKRTVVKRPLRAAYLAEKPPSFSIKAKSSRYDIYLRPHL